MNSNRYSIDHVKIYIEQNTKHILVSDTYKNNHTKITLKCKEHGIFDATFKGIKKGDETCKQCSYKNRIDTTRHSYDYVYNYIEENTPHTLVSRKYRNNKKKLRLKCKDHGIFDIGFGSLVRTNAGCRDCASEIHAKTLTYTYKYISSFVNKNTCYKMISRKYKSSKQKIRIQCEKHGNFDILFNDIQQKHGCRDCSFEKRDSKGEIECRQIIEDITGKKFTKVRPFFLTSPITGYKLELDGYNEELKIAFEYDGRQHFKPISYFGGKHGFLNLQKNDKIKNKLCKKNDIQLIRIPYWIKDRETYIKEQIGDNYGW